MSRDDDSGRLSRRRLLQGTVLTGGVLGAAGLYRVASDSATAQNNDESVTAEFCGSFSPGPQVQQCIDCVEEQCPGEDVNALTPIFTGLTGECFSPDTIPTGAEYVSLKGATNCYVAPVDGATTFCMPDGAPDISNATFYRCGGEPTPEIVDVSVTCSAITVTTANIPNGTTVTATTTFVDAESNESTTVFQATVQENSATFSLPGDKNPIFVTLSLNGTDLDSQSIVASDFPCTEKPPDPPTPDDPRIDDITVTCKSITITTVDIPAGATLEVTLEGAGGVLETQFVTVQSDGTAMISLPGYRDAYGLRIRYDSETLFDATVFPSDAPCGEPPGPPTPKEEKYRKRKKKEKTGVQ